MKARKAAAVLNDKRGLGLVVGMLVIVIAPGIACLDNLAVSKTQYLRLKAALVFVLPCHLLL
jgi:hypothetical protein